MSDTDLEAASSGAPANPPPSPARQRSEQDYIDLAAEIGFARPNLRQTTEPEYFQQWADRVEQGLAHLKRGEFEKFKEIRQEADLYAGATAQENSAPLPPDRISERKEPDHLDDIVTQLGELRPFLADENPRLADKIEQLSAERLPPGSPLRDDYETDVSRALQDAERLVGPVDTDPGSRAALSRRATSAPGLENERLKRLVELTPELSDQKLVDRIRARAGEIAKSPEQDNDRIREIVNDLAFEAAVAERRRPEPWPREADDRPTPPEALKLVEEGLGLRGKDDPRPSSTRDAESEAEARSTPGTLSAEDSTGSQRSQPDATHRAESDRQLAAFGPEPTPNPERKSSAAPRSASLPETERAPSSTAEPTPSRATNAGVRPTTKDTEAPIGAPKASANPAPPPRPSDRPDREDRQASANKPEDKKNPEEKQEAQRGQLVQRTGAAAFIDFIARRTEERKNAREAGTDEPRIDYAVETGPAMPAEFKGRMDQWQAGKQQDKIAEDIAKAEKAGQDALKALEALEDGPAKQVLQRIRAAAEQTEGGMEQVMEEMRPGGQYESLGQDFQTTIKKTQGLEASFHQAESTLASYGKHRAQVAGLVGTHQNAHAITEKFEALDRKIGEKSWVIPSAEGDKKMFDKLAETARNVFDKLANIVRAGFTERPGASASARPSPGF